MDVRAEAVRLLRQNFKDGATIGHLIGLVAELYRGREKQIYDEELRRCFEDAFELDVGAVIYVQLRDATGLRFADATAQLFPEIMKNRDLWDPVESRKGETCWLDTLPYTNPANVAEFDHPLFEEWYELSQASRDYVNRLKRSGAWHAHRAHLMSCLAERVEEKAVGGTKSERR